MADKSKFIFINNIGFTGILKLSYDLKIGDHLYFRYEVYKITNKEIVPIIEKSFYDNPENEELFKNVSSSKLFGSEKTQHQMTKVYEKLKKHFDNNYDEEKNIIKTPLSDELLVPMDKYQYQLMLSFIYNFVFNYETIITNIQHERNKKKVEENNYNDENKDENNMEVFIGDRKIDDHSILNILMEEYSLNNYIRYYLCGKIDEKKKHLSKVNIKTSNEDENEIIVYYLPLIDIYFNNYYQKDLILLYNSQKNNINEKVMNNNLIDIFKLFYHTINNNNIELTNKKIIVEYCLDLIVIYYVVMSDGAIDIDFETFKKIIKNVINKSIQKLNIDKKITIKYMSEYNLKENDDFEINNDVIKKYGYLKNIDKKLFVDKIFEDTETKEKESNLNVEFTLKNGKILDIVELIKNKKYYFVIEDDNLNENNIITKEYHQILKAMNGTNLLVIKDLDLTISKYSDIILAIFNKIDKNSKMIKMNLSTLLILEKFISPNIKTNDIDIKTKFKILYNLVIPYIYDNYKVTKFVDYF